MMRQVILQMEGVSKSFHTVKALDDVSFDLRQGEIHALLGENGAGKSTLMKILSGAIRPDAGEITIDGKPIAIRNPLVAHHTGIATVYQELMLVPHLTVAENVYMGRESINRLGMIDRRTMNRMAATLFEKLNISLEPNMLVSQLSVAKRQMVEIARALSYEPKVLVMDEPTSAISQQEVEHLLRYMESLKAMGIAIVFISHKMEEVFRVADRATVLRDGRYIGTLERQDIQLDRVIEMMVGRKTALNFCKDAMGTELKPLMEVSHLTNRMISDVSFTLHEGEILGFAGLVGAGRSETMRAIFGIDEIEKGAITLCGETIKPKHPLRMIRRGVGFAPEDRKEQALFLDFAVNYNINIAQLVTSAKRLRSAARENAVAREQIGKLNIKVSSPNQLVKNLSGGNQQKVVITRWLTMNPKVLILDEPTRGIDIGAKNEVYEILRSMRSRGISIIFVSSELPELLAIADRILVMRQGRIAGEVAGQTATQERIMKLATGQAEEGTSACLQ